jgi:hypothetical protein
MMKINSNVMVVMIVMLCKKSNAITKIITRLNSLNNDGIFKAPLYMFSPRTPFNQ